MNVTGGHDATQRPQSPLYIRLTIKKKQRNGALRNETEVTLRWGFKARFEQLK